MEEDKSISAMVVSRTPSLSFDSLYGHCTYHNRMDRRSAANNNAEDCPTTETRMSKKNHECSVCRKVFTSGQALGGHMRKHYNARLAKEETRRPAPQFLFDLNLRAMPEY
ncbi:Zinc finger protein AZF2 [Acorus calamus]|uniref:Zinc finger protein AZF2 n=1 Tax=Acorus calamus TaxID=4465 RepID=A0AAV9EGL1_ACOCL|nr:Zinc finger protein AZF2 [Acorus calamus]